MYAVLFAPVLWFPSQENSGMRAKREPWCTLVKTVRDPGQDALEPESRKLLAPSFVAKF